MQLNRDSGFGFSVCMLGGFVMDYKDKKLSESINRTRQVWTLMEYLIYNRNTDIAQESLYRLLWEDERVDDPANALKNLIYRARVMLRDAFGPNFEFIVFKRNSYCWNDAIPCTLDVEIFESLLKEAASAAEDDDKARLYLEAIDLYKGDFLPKSSGQEWVIPLATHYHNQFIACVENVVTLLWGQKRSYDVLEICLKAINVEPYNESLHKNIILAYLSLGNSNQALLHYQYVTNLFYRELGVKLSREIRELYREIVKSDHAVELDLSVIRDDLEEAGEIEGPLFCEYEMFKSIYCLQNRSVERTGESLYLLLVSVCGREGTVPQVKTLNKAMDKLRDVLKVSLRKNDVASLFSQNQFVLLLQSLSYENVEMIRDRIERGFQKQFSGGGVRLCYSFEPLLPKNQMAY